MKNGEQNKVIFKSYESPKQHGVHRLKLIVKGESENNSGENDNGSTRTI